MNNKFWIIFAIIAAGLALIILLLFIANIIVSKKKKHKMFADFSLLLSKIASENENVTVERIAARAKNDKILYDFTLETPTIKYYFKLIANYQEYEITINNSIKWQIRRSYTDESLNYAPGVEDFMRLDIPNDNGKENKKVYVIYPNSRSLLKYVNECEMEFITPDTDIYGSKVITYNALNENTSLLKL